MNTETDGPTFEPVTDMDNDELRSMILGYVGVASRFQLIEMLATCRELFFGEDE
jgi:hypothetical protein